MVTNWVAGILPCQSHPVPIFEVASCLLSRSREAIAAAHDIIPQTERPDQHIRQAHPGDYRRKLKPETIAALNAVLGRFFLTFGYAA
jgi:hypothetical protein